MVNGYLRRDERVCVCVRVCIITIHVHIQFFCVSLTINMRKREWTYTRYVSENRWLIWTGPREIVDMQSLISAVDHKTHEHTREPVNGLKVRSASSTADMLQVRHGKAKVHIQVKGTPRLHDCMHACPLLDSITIFITEAHMAYSQMDCITALSWTLSDRQLDDWGWIHIVIWRLLDRCWAYYVIKSLTLQWQHRFCYTLSFTRKK